jgi:hypothetical protein
VALVWRLRARALLTEQHAKGFLGSSRPLVTRSGGDRQKSLALCQARTWFEEGHLWGATALPVC